MLQLNKKEMALGAGFGFALTFMVGPLWGILATFVCSFLWSYGGSGAGRIWRYGGVPAFALLMLVVTGVPIKSLILPTAFAMLVFMQGYGIPTPGLDEGSRIGRFFYNWAKREFPPVAGEDGQHYELRIDKVATLFTRGLLSILLGLSYISLINPMPVQYVLFFTTMLAIHYVAIENVEGNWVI